jgi:cytochrome c oxidase cbb3-type subunit IV
MIEISIVRGILTVLLMLAFITLTVWLYARKHRQAYDEAARLPLEEDAVNPVANGKGVRKGAVNAVSGKAGQQS